MTESTHRKISVRKKCAVVVWSCGEHVRTHIGAGYMNGVRRRTASFLFSSLRMMEDCNRVDEVSVAFKEILGKSQK